MNMKLTRLRLCLLFVCAGLAMPIQAQDKPGVNDPFESFNRKIFNFNEAVDGAVLQPVSRAYRDKVPQTLRTGVSNFFGNLRDLWSGINSALQAKPGPAISNTGRFLINSTVGIYGIFDVATSLGIERHTEDLGQTLGRWGVSTGPYLVLPIFGPSTLRDAAGLVVDSRANLINQVNDIPERNTLFAASLIDTRARLLSITDQVDQVALDKYTFTRDAYLQKRLNDVYDGDPPESPDPSSEDNNNAEPDRNEPKATL
jgi:phospholipid-binding lipoprotein MlaA